MSIKTIIKQNNMNKQGESKMGVTHISRALDYSQPLKRQVNASDDTGLKRNNKQVLLSTENIEFLWDELSEVYGNLFVNKYGLEDSGMWFEILGDLTNSEIEYGLNKIKYSKTGGKFDEFPPNPVQFRTLCLEYDFENRVPSTRAAFTEAVNNIERLSNPHWSHPAVQATALKLLDELKTQDEYKIYPKFKHLYEVACRRLKHEKLPLNVSNLPKLTKQRNESIGDSHLQGLYKHLGAR